MPLELNEISQGLRVRLGSNTLKHGILTGRTRETNRGILAEVDFGPADKSFKRIQLLDIVKENETAEDLILFGKFGKIRDFRSRLTALKVGGDLTDIFYSLGQDRTTFYPHQFLPVLKFIQSVPGRLLIADEVGLGKTIEAAYIWKEIEARHDAHTWLIICPSVLKEKWKEDLMRLFSMEVNILSGYELYVELKSIENGDRYKERIMITSIEGIRINNGLWDYIENSATNSFPLLDLVTVDEAHHLRNPGTKSHQIVALIRDIATHLLLLSATPIQTEALNLYNLLKILEPDDFDDQQSFELQITQNRNIVEAIRKLSTRDFSIDDTGLLLEKALELHFFKDNPLLVNILSSLADLDDDDRVSRLKLAEELEKVSLFHRFINRTRKRDVISTRVLREAHEIEVTFNSEEKYIYDSVTAILQSMSNSGGGPNIFALIMRQRQMASSLPAAIRAWKKKAIDAEQVWEDFGMVMEDDGFNSVSFLADEVTNNELEILESNDSKYKALYSLLDEIRHKTPETKIVLFSFFRETLSYLSEKLSADGFHCMLFVGGVKDKTAAITEFRDSSTLQVLLSSEIGSEGVDLQFCRIIINFDLPWNPMRVEQRIGRIDRIGQDAEKILIYNFVREDSIEERILYRLLERIGIFRNSIGEIEEIFGNEMEKLAKDMFNPHLTQEQRENRIKQTEDALANRERIQKELEDEAWQLSGLTDYLISQINQKREAGHWVRPGDLKNLTIDYLESYYPGCQLENGDDTNTLLIMLSREAVRDLIQYLEAKKISSRTGLTKHRTILLDFDPNRTNIRRDIEIVTVRHPLIRWISNSIIARNEIIPTACIEINSGQVNIPEGIYVFGISFFSINGLFRKRELGYSVCSSNDLQTLNPVNSEVVVQTALQKGHPHRNLKLQTHSASLQSAFNVIEEDFNERYENFISNAADHNKTVILQQRMRIQSRAMRRIEELKERITRFKTEGKDRLVPMTEGLLKKEQNWEADQLSRLENLESADEDFKDIAAGIIVVKGE